MRHADQRRACPVQFGGACADAVRLQAGAGAAERVGQDDLRPGGDVFGVDAAHDFGMFDVHQFRRVPALEAAREEQRAHAAVGDDDRVGFE